MDARAARAPFPMRDRRDIGPDNSALRFPVWGRLVSLASDCLGNALDQLDKQAKIHVSERLRR